MTYSCVPEVHVMALVINGDVSRRDAVIVSSAD